MDEYEYSTKTHQIYNFGWKSNPSCGPAKHRKEPKKGLSGTKNDLINIA